MKKIALVSSGDLPIPAVKGGAVETLIDLLVKENEKEHKVNFLVISVNDDEAKKKTSLIKNSSFEYVKSDNFLEKKLSKVTFILNKLSKILFKNEIPTYSAFYKKALKKVLKYNVDFVVFEGGPRPTGFHYFKKYFKQDQMCIHLHGNWFPSKYVSNMFGRVISVSKFIENEYISTCNSKNAKFFTVYNTVNQDSLRTPITSEERNQIRKSFAFSEKDFVIVYCGRICADKGVLELIKAVVNCSENVKLLIIGSPHYGKKETSPYLNEVNTMVSNFNNKIFYTGYIPNNQLFKYYKSSDIHCIPSVWDEPAGLVNVEGMTVGLPLIVTKSGGNSEYVSEQCALLVERGENLISNLEKAIEKLCTNTSLRKEMSNESLKRSEMFSVSNFYTSYLRCFE